MENTTEKRLYQMEEIQLTYKSNVKPSLRPKINGSRDAFDILYRQNAQLARSQFFNFLLVPGESSKINSSVDNCVHKFLADFYIADTLLA